MSKTLATILFCVTQTIWAGEYSFLAVSQIQNSLASNHVTSLNSGPSSGKDGLYKNNQNSPYSYNLACSKKKKKGY